MGLVDAVLGTYGDIVTGAQETVQSLGDNLADVVMGGQETVRSVVGDVTDVPGEVAEPVADAAAAPFALATYALGGTVLVVLGDELLNDGKARRSIFGW